MVTHVTRHGTLNGEVNTAVQRDMKLEWRGEHGRSGGDVPDMKLEWRGEHNQGGGDTGGMKLVRREQHEQSGGDTQ